MQSKIKKSITALLLITSISACKKDKELPPVEENELITTIRLKFTNKANASDVKFYDWKDLDGQGGNAPSIDQVILSQNSMYKLEIASILNETAVPAGDIKQEIKDEAHAHLFVYKPLPASLLAVTITDRDKNNLPIGFVADLATTTAGSGKLQIILRHQMGSKNGTEQPGSTDLDASFDLTIQ
ncbi:MAG: hypothetical protein H7Y07_01780 [Pyrinomonadaceae bacterium]|nr:hypothetical protein [Sphingobacteriaceae bacterium]